MARRTKIIHITDEGRDKGKKFLLTEMPPSQAEAWAFRALLALANNNAQIPDASLGMAGLAQLGITGLAGLPWIVAEPLLKEMFDCIQICPDAKNPSFTRPLEPAGEGDYDIEEIATRLKLRKEIFNLHINFSSAAFQSLFGKEKEAASKHANTKTESQK